MTKPEDLRALRLASDFGLHSIFGFRHSGFRVTLRTSSPNDSWPNRGRHGDFGRSGWLRRSGHRGGLDLQLMNLLRQPILRLRNSLADLGFGKFHLANVEVRQVLESIDRLAGGLNHFIPA